MRHIGLLAVGLCLSLSSSPYAQADEKENEFSMSLPRAEYRNGALTPRDKGVSAATFINNRTRLSLGYKRPGLSLRISAQHVGV